jgi:hypothetical protein
MKEYDFDPGERDQSFFPFLALANDGNSIRNQKRVFRWILFKGLVHIPDGWCVLLTEGELMSDETFELIHSRGRVRAEKLSSNLPLMMIESEGVMAIAVGFQNDIDNPSDQSFAIILVQSR